MFFRPKQKKIFILLGHSDKESFCAGLANAYENGAREAGHEVRRLNIIDLKFDPILHKGYKAIQELEPDLKMVQENIRWSNHFVILYPMWWSSMPAYLKGMLDRMWLPGFAFHFWHNGLGWSKLLKGRSASVFVTMDSWPPLSRFLFGDSLNEIKWAILWFSGFSPVWGKKIGRIKNTSEGYKKRWLRKMEHLGQKAK